MQNLANIGAAVLDTHAWLWISAGASEAVAAATFRGRCIVSAISVWEVSMLAEKGRLELAPDLDVWISKNLTAPVELEPFRQLLPVQRCFHYDMRLQISDEEHLPLALPHKRKAVGPRKLSAPFVDEFACLVVDDDVVGNVIGEQDDVALPATYDAVTVFDRCCAAQIAPVGNHPVTEITVAEDLLGRLGDSWEPCTSEAGGE